jgi:hypothetical protein
MNSFLIQSRRHFSAHNTLLGAASRYLQAAEQNERFCHDGDLVALVMTALALESLCNTAGELIIPDWKDFETSSPRAKTRLLCERLGITYDKQQEPFASLVWLMKFRNKIAHAKPEALLEEATVTQDQYNAVMAGHGPQSSLEKQISHDSARRALRAIEQFQEMLYEKLPGDVKHVVAVDIIEFSSGTHIRPGPR